MEKSRFRSPWSIQEETLFRELYPTNTAKEIAKIIGRPASALCAKAFKLGLSDGHVWSKKELDQITKLYPDKTAQEIADQIGRTVAAVRHRTYHLGLSRIKYMPRKKP